MQAPPPLSPPAPLPSPTAVDIRPREALINTLAYGTLASSMFAAWTITPRTVPNQSVRLGLTTTVMFAMGASFYRVFWS